MDAVQAILTVLGYKANQGGQATLVHLGGCWQQEQEQVQGLGLELKLELELEQGLEQELEFELELVVGESGIGEAGTEEAGTGCLASKAGRAALEPDLELDPELELGI